MSWVRLDDGFAGHRKVLPLSDAAFRLEVAAICWCNQHANDGHLAAADVRLLCGYLSDPGQAKAAVLELVAAGLWDATESGHRLHDYDKYQPSAQERRASNEAAAERMRKYRERRHSKPADAAQQQPDRAGYAVTVTPSYAGFSASWLAGHGVPPRSKALMLERLTPDLSASCSWVNPAACRAALSLCFSIGGSFFSGVNRGLTPILSLG